MQYNIYTWCMNKILNNLNKVWILIVSWFCCICFSSIIYSLVQRQNPPLQIPWSKHCVSAVSASSLQLMNSSPNLQLKYSDSFWIGILKYSILQLWWRVYTSSILSSKFVFLLSISWRSEAASILSILFSSCLGPQHQLDIPFHLF